jgi:lipopolysaccharide heptosyltransferase II
LNPSAWIRSLARTSIHRFLHLLIGSVGMVAMLGNRRREGPAGSVRTILIVRLDLLGDVVFTLPLVRGLRQAYPDARVVLVTLPYTASIAEADGVADEVITLDSNRVRRPMGMIDPRTWLGYIHAVRRIRALQPDLAISVAGKTASLVAFLSGAARSTGYEGEAYRFMLSDPVAGGRYEERVHEVEYVRRLARYSGAANSPRRLSVQVTDRDVRSMQAKLGSLHLAPNGALVVVHAGSINGSAKRWPSLYWAEFVDAVTARTGATVVLAGAESDKALSEEVLNGARGRVRSLVGDTTVGELVALIARADLVASGDSGPLHLAVALGRPLVAAYGPTDPYVHGPYHPSAPVRIHRKDLPCSPCYSMAAVADCPLGDALCMKLITVEEMVQSVVDLLDGAA